MKKRVVPWKNLPMRAPFMTALFVYLCMDYWSVPGWVHGVVWTIIGLYTFGWIYECFTREEIDL